MDMNDLLAIDPPAAQSTDPPTAQPTVAENVAFGDFVTLLEKIQKTQGNAKKREILNKFIQHWRKIHDDFHKAKKTVIFFSFSFFGHFRWIFLLG